MTKSYFMHVCVIHTRARKSSILTQYFLIIKKKNYGHPVPSTYHHRLYLDFLQSVLLLHHSTIEKGQ
jgi:hypothetical protein